MAPEPSHVPVSYSGESLSFEGLWVNDYGLLRLCSAQVWNPAFRHFSSKISAQRYDIVRGEIKKVR